MGEEGEDPVSEGIRGMEGGASDVQGSIDKEDRATRCHEL